MMRLLLALLLIVGLAAPAWAQRLVTNLSNSNVAISSSFDGETLTFFGTIEPDVGATVPYVEGPFDVVIRIIGPAQDRVARLKTNVLGLWLNTDQVVFEKFPSYYHVLASRPLTEITDSATLAVENIPLDAQSGVADEGWWKSTVFNRQLVRLMTERGKFGLEPRGVNFASNTFYSARLTLPTDVPNGSFLAQTLLFKNGQLIARHSDRFTVRKVDFERFVATSARSYPLLYGVTCVALALFTGWLGGVIFRR